MLQSPLVIEPGGMQENPQHRKLEEILSTIALSQYGMYPIFLCNEEESKQFEQLTFSSKIIHTSQTIKLIQGNNERLFDVPKLDNIMTYVGAGDAFLAGIVYQLLQENRIDPEFAILVAQRYMINKL